MSDRTPTEVLEFRSLALPQQSFAKSLYDPRLMRLSDKGGASELIGNVWSEIVAATLLASLGKPLMAGHPVVGGAVVDAVHRLDDIPGVASRASKAHLKNPDFLVVASLQGEQVLFGVDAKFSIETAETSQVSAEMLSKLVASDPHVSLLIQNAPTENRIVDGVFASPDYELTYEMFEHRVGFRRCSVARENVLLVSVTGGAAFSDTGDQRVLQQLIDLDGLPINVRDSLLATQYYVRLERAVSGLVREQRQPLLGNELTPPDADDALTEVVHRAPRYEVAWGMIRDWDQELEEMRQQRQALQQAIGTLVRGPVLREASDQIMPSLNLEHRPSRNQIRKALSRRYAGDVRSRVGVVRWPVQDFSAELHRVALIAADVARSYQAELLTILKDVILDVSSDARNASDEVP